MPADVPNTDLAIAKSAIAQVRKDKIRRLFVQALVEDNPERRAAILNRLAEFIEQGRRP